MNLFSEDMVKEMYKKNFELQNGRPMNEEETRDLEQLLKEGKKVTDQFKNQFQSAGTEDQKNKLVQSMILDMVSKITTIAMDEEKDSK